MKEFDVNDVFDLICRNGGRMGYKDMAEALGVNPGEMVLRNKLVKLKRRGLIEYIPAESAWRLTDAGRRKAERDGG